MNGIFLGKTDSLWRIWVNVHSERRQRRLQRSALWPPVCIVFDSGEPLEFQRSEIIRPVMCCIWLFFRVERRILCFSMSAFGVVKGRGCLFVEQDVRVRLPSAFFLGSPSDPERDANVCLRLQCFELRIVFLSRKSTGDIDSDFLRLSMSNRAAHPNENPSCLVGLGKSIVRQTG